MIDRLQQGLLSPYNKMDWTASRS